MGTLAGLFHSGSRVIQGHITGKNKGQDAGPGLSSQWFSGFNTAYMLRSDKEYLPCHPRHCLLVKTVKAIVHVVIHVVNLKICITRG